MCLDRVNETEWHTTEGSTVLCRPSGNVLRPWYEILKGLGLSTRFI